ncbi:MAG: hypothetical protein KME32_31230 [Mojavia pulchra JT2-VF2]|jgi:hypothetical protein|uniref:Uncharacterized protein n=1 Tax=Mojavia pulchra JT2-VF2 TaxID=287848 RepID=A0A951Q519_9NOST|nr:hypothetical protein [Mojavia pulchra JT2-VF2]
MSSISCPCCVVVFNRQQEQNINHQKHCQDAPEPNKKSVVKCTVVENGRVVVKPLQPLPSEAVD